MANRLLSLLLMSAVISAPAQAEMLKAASESIEQRDDSSVDPGVRSEAVVPLKARFQGETQGAGTPNQVGAGIFVPLGQGEKHVFYADVQAAVNLSDFSQFSSIDTTLLRGATVSTSTRVGVRWLNDDKTWLYGVNAGYDTRPMATGETVDGIDLLGTEQTVFFQQLAVGAEVASDSVGFNAYALLPVGQTEQLLNWYAAGGALNTYGLDMKVRPVDRLSAALGYYYQEGDLGAANGSGVKAELSYALAEDVTVALKGTYDEAFETRVSGNIVYKFGGGSSRQSSGQASPQSSLSDGLLIALNTVPSHRDVRVHDCHIWDLKCDFSAIGSGVKHVWGDVSSGISWGDAFIDGVFVTNAEKFGLSAKQARYILHTLEDKLGEKIARSVFKKILKRVLRLSEDTEKLAEEDTAGLREFASKVRNAYAEDGLDGVAEVVAENPELAAEALGEAAEIAVE